MLHQTDNKNAELVSSVGSCNKELHQEAVAVYKLCREMNMCLSVGWVSRDYNVEVDQLSRFNDPNDYMLDPSCFRYIDQLWGPHTLDRFASLQTRQLERFCSRYRNSRCEAVDTFTNSWLKENNWIFPPPYLIPRVLKHMSAGGDISTLLLPRWPSAVWCPLLVNTDGSWKAFITGSMTFQPYQGIFLAGSAASNVFTSDILISDSSPSCLLSLVAQVRIICGSDHLAVIPCVIVGVLDYVSVRYHCMWLSRIMLSVVTMY